MKIGLIADPHANRYGIQAVLERLRDCSVVLCAGACEAAAEAGLFVPPRFRIFGNGREKVHS